MSTQSKARLKPGLFVALEGLDATGKSTQLRKFEQAAHNGMFDHEIVLTHQPSGGNAVGNAVYAVTENGDIASPLARQFLHLASHAEHYTRTIIPALDSGVPVVLDRFWWSTFAYGYYAGGLKESISFDQFYNIATLPAQGKYPDVVFLFLDPYQEDPHNTVSLLRGYEELADGGDFDPGTVVRVPQGDPESTFLFITMALCDLGLAS